MAAHSETPRGQTLPAQDKTLFARSDNERLILTLINRFGEIPASSIAKETGLSAQSASVISRLLETQGLVVKGEPVRGRIGKPSVPIMLNRDGAFSIGLRIGRRSADLVLIDLACETRGTLRQTYKFPTPKVILDFVKAGIEELVGALHPSVQNRIAGIGVGAPFELWKWLDNTSVPKDEMLAWKAFDFVTAFRSFTDLPIFVSNDTSMSCIGEHAFGSAKALSDFAYFYIGSFVGGGVILNNHLYLGESGNAAAFGSFPIRDRDGNWGQLIGSASLFQLENMLERRFPGEAQRMLQAEDWLGFDDLLDRWLQDTAGNLAYAIVMAVAAYDVPKVVIDGSIPPAIRKRLTDMVTQEMQNADTRGIRTPAIQEGILGNMAGALGAAYQPIAMQILSE